MLLNAIANRLRGEVRIRVESVFPERVLNLCGARKLAFWDLVWVSPTEFACSVSRRDYQTLRRAAEKLECTLRVEERAGVPFFMDRLRRRRALLLGAALCAAALTLGSFFIWDFTVEGNTSVSDEEILRVLEENGVKLGTFGFSVDGEDLRNHVLLELPRLSWIAVNVSGCQAHVQVRERIPKPELFDKRTPCNLIARRAGLVLSVNPLDGEKLVVPGTTVEQGQILVSGVQDTGTFGARIAAGMGTVTARTWYTLQARMPLRVERKQYTGKEKRGFSLIFGRRRVKFYGNANTSGENYDKIMTRTQLCLFGLHLPVTAEEETYRFYRTEEREAAPETAEREAEAFLTAYLHTLVDRYGTVNSTLCTSKRSGDVLLVTLSAECREQIGVRAPIYLDNK
ncbi:MAG: sporulation protein YqfD [Oscillibacter sp.]|jgi:similar to stage IV sporulation protein|nr:sporulation protein YqfD [Oscillibacter sp.]